MNKRLFYILYGLFTHKTLRRLGVVKALMVLSLGGGLWYAYEYHYARPKASYGGIPESQGVNLAHIFRRSAYIAEYSERYGNPLWVMYRLEAVGEHEPIGKRPSRFYAETWSLQGVKHDDYTGSGYDRGHLAPNYAIARVHGRKAQLETFSMINVVPQKPNLNRKLWQRLEELAISEFAEHLGSVWVITGPIFGDDPEYLPGSSVAIPEAFFKIYIDPSEEDNKPEKVLAFLIPQTAPARSRLENYVTSIDEIERQAQLDFLPLLEDELEARLEQSQTSNAWGLEALDTGRNRF